MTQCWYCHKKLEIQHPIPFKSTCEYCNSWIHVCKLCRFYCPGQPNDCVIPETHEPDKEKANHCDDFKLKEETEQNNNNMTKDEIENRLFGSTEKQTKSKASSTDRFNKLFEDS